MTIRGPGGHGIMGCTFALGLTWAGGKLRFGPQLPLFGLLVPSSNPLDITPRVAQTATVVSLVVHRGL